MSLLGGEWGALWHFHLAGAHNALYKTYSVQWMLPYPVFTFLLLLQVVFVVNDLSDERATLCVLSPHQPLSKAHLCLWSLVLSSLLLSSVIPFLHLIAFLSFSLLLYKVYKHVQQNMHYHTLLACLFGLLISSSLVVFSLSQPLIRPLILPLLLSPS